MKTYTRWLQWRLLLVCAIVVGLAALPLSAGAVVHAQTPPDQLATSDTAAATQANIAASEAAAAAAAALAATQPVTFVSTTANIVPVTSPFVATVFTPSFGTNGPYSSTVGVPIVFNAGGQGWTNPVVTWNFGDGTVGTGLSVSHAYSAPGTYTVGVSVVDQSTQQAASASTSATVSPTGFAGQFSSRVCSGFFSGVYSTFPC